MSILSLRENLRNWAGIAYRRMFYFTVGYRLHKSGSRVMIEYRPDFHYNFKGVTGYPELLEGWIAGNRDMNLGDMSRFYMIYINVVKVLEDRVPGDFVELGVYKGNSASLLAGLARRANRRVYLFDTFSGFDSRDLGGPEQGRSVQFEDTSLSEVKALVGTEGVTYVSGFFPDSASGMVTPESIAVAHIDCDLYAPMKAGLEYFYPRLSVGGVMFLHDYGSGYWPGAKRAIDEFFRDLPEKPIVAPDKCGTAIVRKSTPPRQ